MTLASPTTLVCEIRRELDGHNIMQAPDSGQIADQLDTVECSMNLRDGFDAGAVDLAVAGLTTMRDDECVKPLPAVLEGVGDGQPAKKVQHHEEDQQFYADCVAELRQQLCQGAGSMAEIVKSTDLTLSLTLNAVLELLKLTRWTPADLIDDCVVDTVLSGLSAAGGTSEDTNSCIGEVLDEMEGLCIDVSELPEADTTAAEDCVVDSGGERQRTEGLATHAASAGGLAINFDIAIDLNGGSSLDLEELQQWCPPSISVDDIGQIMTGPLGELGGASSLGGLGVINSEIFEACECPLIVEPEPEPVEIPVEIPAEDGVIPPPEELAEVEEPAPPPKKLLAGTADPETMAAATQPAQQDAAVDMSPPSDPAPHTDPADDPASRVRKVEIF